METGDSLRVARNVKRDFPGARIIIMDLLPVQEDIVEFISAGVSGFIMKDASLEEVVGTIRSVVMGNEVLPNQMTSTLFSEIAKEAVSNGGSEDSDSVRMTPREREVLDLIAEGLSNKAIAKRLEISTPTVKSHVRNIMEKLTLHTRLQLAAYPRGRGDEWSSSTNGPLVTDRSSLQTVRIPVLSRLSDISEKRAGRTSGTIPFLRRVP